MVKSTPPEKVKNKSYLVLPYLLAVALVVMVLAQLMSFEDFAKAIASYQSTTSEGSVVIAVMLVALEIASLPFLLRLHLSPLARFLSVISLLVAPVAWLILMTSAVIGDVAVENVGLLGGFVPIELGSLAFAKVGSFIILAVWSFLVLGGVGALDFRADKKSDKA